MHKLFWFFVFCVGNDSKRFVISHLLTPFLRFYAIRIFHRIDDFLSFVVSVLTYLLCGHRLVIFMIDSLELFIEINALMSIFIFSV